MIVLKSTSALKLLNSLDFMLECGNFEEVKCIRALIATALNLCASEHLTSFVVRCGNNLVSVNSDGDFVIMSDDQDSLAMDNLTLGEL